MLSNTKIYPIIYTMKNILLIIMIISYTIPIYYVYSNYDSNTSVSSIICNEKCKHIILFFMFLMGIGTLLYEAERKDTYSQIMISVLLIGIYGLIYVNETNTAHYIFAFLVFIAILLFMIRHYYLRACNPILASSLVLEIAMLIFIIQHIDDNIFYGEIIYILNFAFFFIYLHILQ